MASNVVFLWLGLWRFWAGFCSSSWSLLLRNLRLSARQRKTKCSRYGYLEHFGFTSSLPRETVGVGVRGPCAVTHCPTFWQSMLSYWMMPPMPLRIKYSKKTRNNKWFITHRCKIPSMWSVICVGFSICILTAHINHGDVCFMCMFLSGGSSASKTFPERC